MADEFDTNEGLTRREALKKGAMLGGALVWAVPVVQTIGMSPAFAASVSGCCIRGSLEVLVNNGTSEDSKFKICVINCGSYSCDLDVTVEVRAYQAPDDWASGELVYFNLIDSTFMRTESPSCDSDATWQPDSAGTWTLEVRAKDDSVPLEDIQIYNIAF